MAKHPDKSEDSPKHGPRMTNRKARHDYEILQVLECGIELTGTEVKSLRGGQGKIDEAYARVRDGQLVLIGAHIAPYPQAAALMQHEPTRERRLLVHHRQIAELESHVRQKGNTIVPLTLYFHRGWAKVEIGLAVGKRKFDKRADIKKREQERDINRAMGKRDRR